MQNLSTKELNYVKDILSWELLASKKCNAYANQDKDPGRQQLHYDVAKAHQENYEKILTHITRYVNPQKGMVQ